MPSTSRPDNSSAAVAAPAPPAVVPVALPRARFRRLVVFDGRLA